MSLRALALLCFFLSGATGLFYEVLWTRLLGLTIGNTHFSITVVVSVFMGGLALGSFLGGRLADRSRNPLALYGLLVLAVGILCLLVPLAVDAGRPFFAWIYQSYDGTPGAMPLLLARILFCALLILAPTTCMGATLPALSRFFASRMSEVGFTVGRLYAVNTLGAVLGVSFAGFFAIERLGLWGTTAVAVVIDVGIGLLVLCLARTVSIGGEVAGKEAASATTTAGPPTTRLPSHVRLAVLAFAATGFANMMLQLAWTNSIVLSIGNSTYAFSLIVTLFILGIGIGGGVMSFIVDRLKNLNLALGAVVTATGVLASVTVPVLGHFPILAARLFDRVEEPSYGKFLAIQLVMVSLVILPVTILMGTVFPLVGKIRTRHLEKIGSSVGSAYFANTLGSVLGTLAAGFLFIPLLGQVYYTLYLGAGISLGVGLILVATSLRFHLPVRLAVVSAAALVVLVPGYILRPYDVLGSETHLWHPAVLSHGAYIYFPGAYYRNRARKEVRPVDEHIRRLIDGQQVRFYREGLHAPVAVVEGTSRDRRKRRLALRIAGKVEASVAPEGGYTDDMPAQLLAGHLPMILHPAPREVLTLGLGGGITLGTLTLYGNTVERIDSLEISPEVVEAARRFFSEPNRQALDAPRLPVRSIIGDGRNHLLYTTRRYDVITSVPSNPWIAGIGNLFTEEFFRICKERLRPGGVVCNWIHKGNMRAADMKTVVRTFTQVFDEHAQLWDLGYDCLMVGSNRPLTFDGERLKEVLEDPDIRADLLVLGITGPATFLRDYRMDAAAMKAYAGPSGALNTDSFPILEFSCPFGLYGHVFDAYRDLLRARQGPLSTEWIRGIDEDGLEAAGMLRDAFGRLQHAEALYARLSGGLPRGTDPAAPLDPEGLEDYSARLRELDPLRRQEMLDVAEEIVEHLKAIHAALRAHPDGWLEEHAGRLGQLAFGIEGTDLGALLAGYFKMLAGPQPSPRKKLEYLEQALRFGGEDRDAALQAAQAYLELGDLARGIALLAPMVEKRADDPALLLTLAVLHAAGDDLAAALPFFQKALRHATRAGMRSEIHQNLGFAWLRRGQQSIARGKGEETGGNPGAANALYQTARRSLEEARRHYQEAIRLEPGNAKARGQLEKVEKLEKLLESLAKGS